ncbi:MAG: thioredoxin family protein [Bacteroidota bacterium]
MRKELHYQSVPSSSKEENRELIIRLLLIFFILFAQSRAEAQISVHTFEAVDSLQSLAPRPIMVFIETDWCRYCKKMEHTTFKSTAVMDLLEEQFYFVVLNGEEQRTIRFSGYDFNYKPNGVNTGIHELAEALGTINGQVAYPSTCILNEQYEIVFQYQHFLSAKEMEAVLRAVLERRDP